MQRKDMIIINYKKFIIFGRNFVENFHYNEWVISVTRELSPNL